MTPEEVQNLINKTNELRRLNPALRQGQALMNTLWVWHREVYNQISGTDADPFYVDANIERFMAIIQ